MKWTKSTKKSKALNTIPLYSLGNTHMFLKLCWINSQFLTIQCQGKFLEIILPLMGEKSFSTHDPKSDIRVAHHSSSFSTSLLCCKITPLFRVWIRQRTSPNWGQTSESYVIWYRSELGLCKHLALLHHSYIFLSAGRWVFWNLTSFILQLHV
jgi:hypothetical protein